MNKLIIFDCDGTLVDSEFLCNLALENMLRDYEIFVTAKDLMQTYRGEKLSRILASIENRFAVKLNDGFVDAYRKSVALLFSTELESFPDVNETLTRLKNPMCVASSGPKNKIVQALIVTDLLHHFDGQVFSSYDIQSWKPDPDIFLHAAKQMGFLPENCIVVEDSKLGIQAAKMAGMISVFHNPHGVREGVGSDHSITSMSELIAIATS